MSRGVERLLAVTPERLQELAEREYDRSRPEIPSDVADDRQALALLLEKVLAFQVSQRKAVRGHQPSLSRKRKDVLLKLQMLAIKSHPCPPSS